MNCLNEELNTLEHMLQTNHSGCAKSNFHSLILMGQTQKPGFAPLDAQKFHELVRMFSRLPLFERTDFSHSDNAIGTVGTRHLTQNS